VFVILVGEGKGAAALASAGGVTFQGSRAEMARRAENLRRACPHLVVRVVFVGE
jgi:hypothetical protein